MSIQYQMAGYHISGDVAILLDVRAAAEEEEEKEEKEEEEEEEEEEADEDSECYVSATCICAQQF